MATGNVFVEDTPDMFLARLTISDTPLTFDDFMEIDFRTINHTMGTGTGDIWEWGWI